MTTAYTSLLGLALPVTGELSGTWGDTVNTAITSLLDTAVAGTTSITTDADITLTTTTGASNQARQAIILWNPASGTVTRNITAPAQSKIYTVINASGGTQSIVIRGAGPTTGVTIAKGESATVAWNGSDFVKVSSSGGAITFTDLTVTGNTILGDAAADTLTVNATSTFNAPVSFAGLVRLPSTGRSAAAALTVTAPAFLYGVASTYTDTTSSGTIAAMAPFYALSAPTLSTSNVTTYSFASTLYIAGAPAAGGSATITNPYALYVNSGASYFAGAVAVGGATTLGGNLLFSPDGTYDIGTSVGNRPRNIYLQSLTSGRVTFVGTGGVLQDSANFTYAGANAVLSAGRLIVKTLASDSNGLNIYRAAGDNAYVTDFFNGTLYLGVNNTYQLYMSSSNVQTNLVDFYAYGVRLGRGAAAVGTNTVVGFNSLDNASTTGGYNLAVGTLSARAITSGNENVAIGSTVLTALTIGIRNTAVGNNALQYSVSGNYNVALGMFAGNSNLGSNNVFIGYQANGTGTSNSVTGMTVVGYQAAQLNTGYSNQTAVGNEALYTGGGGFETAIGYRATYTANNTGGVNTSVGYEALSRPLTPVRSVAVGFRAMYGGVGSAPIDSVAVGNETLLSITTGGSCVAVGHQALYTNTTGASNTAIGLQALYSNTTSAGNTAVGYQAAYANTTGTFIDAFGSGALSVNTTGNGNSAFGRAVLSVNTTGSENAAFGTAYGVYAALRFNTTGSFNAAFGAGALASNTTSSNNTAVGYQAGYSNISGGASHTFVGFRAGYSTNGGTNAAFGTEALYSNTTGDDNTAVGSYRPLYANTTGSQNVAVGREALRFNTTSSANTAVGYRAAYGNTTGIGNTFVGSEAGLDKTTGNYNTVLGLQAFRVGVGGSDNTMIGTAAGYVSTGSNNTFVGCRATTTNGCGELMTTGSNNTFLGGFNGNQNSLDLRTSNNTIVLSDGSGIPQFYIRYGDANTTAYRLRPDWHGFGRLYSQGTIASGGSVVLNVNGTGNDGSIGTMGVMTRWTSVDGGDSTALYAIAHGNSYNSYTLQQKSEVSSITINESAGSVTISNGSANELQYQFVYTNFSTGQLIRAQI